jgi:phage gp45-like
VHNPFGIIKDSSIWQNSGAFSAVFHKDPYLRIGIVKKVFKDERTSDLRYLVEVRDRNDAIQVNARLMRRFGGAYNYEDVVHHGYKFDDKSDGTTSFEAKAGDAVLVAFLNGEAREAIIIGGLMHSARKSTIDITKGPQYQAEFNGIETTINESGEYKVTFKAIPKNIDKLEETPSKKIPAPEYDTDIGGSYFTFDKTGSFEVNDKAKTDLQNFKINKPNGTVEINSGKIKLLMTKKGEKVELKCKVLNITSDDKINSTTKEFKLEAKTSTKIDSPKVAIGKKGVELLDQLAKLVDAMGQVTPISPFGPCTPLASTPQWPGVVAIQAKIKEITGSL